MPITIHKNSVAPYTCREIYADKTCIIPIEFMSGLFSMFPDTPWISHCVGNNSRGELRSVGTIAIPQEAFSPGSSCSLHFTADVDCTLEIFQLSHNLEASQNTPTWNSISTDCKWPVPGGISKTNARSIGIVQIKVGQVEKLTGKKLSDHFTGCANDGKPNCPPRWGLLIRRSDTGAQTVNIAGELKIESIVK